MLTTWVNELSCKPFMLVASSAFVSDVVHLSDLIEHTSEQVGSKYVSLRLRFVDRACEDTSAGAYVEDLP